MIVQFGYRARIAQGRSGSREHAVVGDAWHELTQVTPEGEQGPMRRIVEDPVPEGDEAAPEEQQDEAAQQDVLDDRVRGRRQRKAEPLENGEYRLVQGVARTAPPTGGLHLAV